jgi:hypothetical protein
LPAPDDGRQFPSQAALNLRNRPTVTSNSSRRKELTDAGWLLSLKRLKESPGMGMVEQHDSLLLDPQLFVSALQLGNGEQVRSEVAEPAAVSLPPARLQSVHAVQLAALVVVLNVPDVQATQTRLAVLEPCVWTRCPG